MEITGIEELENELEFQFHNIFDSLKKIEYKLNENDLHLNFNRIKNNVRASFDDIKMQLENLKRDIIRGK